MITPKAVIFDMDGLMFDTERLGIKAWLRVGEAMGLPITEAMVHKVIGMSWENNKKTWFTDLGDFDFDSAGLLYQDLMKQSVEKHGVPLKRGLIELLAYLDESKVKKAVATSSSSGIVSFYLEKAGLTGCFEQVVTGEAVTRGKPEPDIFLYTAKLLGVAPEECVVLEDSLNGVKAAYAAAMLPIMIPDLIPPTDEIESLLYAKLDSLTDVIPLLKL